MGIIKNFKDKKDKYALTKSVKIADIKQYLQNEYDRASVREDTINRLENDIERYKIIEQKYNAMLVVQEKTTERTKRLDETIQELRNKVKSKNDEITLLYSRQTDIKINAENKLKEKDEEIKELKKEKDKEIKELKKQIRELKKKK